MFRFHRNTLTALFTAALWATALPAHAQDLTVEVDRMFAWATGETPGCVVAAAREGETVIERAYGLADVERRVPLTPSSVFDIGSVQKQFIAAAVLLLVEDGRMALTDDIRTHFPELPDYGHTVTVDHLLTHTSGIRDWIGLLNFSGTDEDALTLLLRQRGLNFPPGEEWSYSNGNFLLAKTLVERVSGQSFDAFAQERMFRPLGMASTMYGADVRAMENHALAYEPDGDGWQPAMLLDEARGPGALLTTATDLLRWNQALDERRLGSFVTEKLQEPARLNNGRELGYGRALFLDENAAGRVLWHSGSADGYKAFLVRFPAERISIALLCNAGEASDRSSARAVYEVLAPEAASRDRENAPTPAGSAPAESAPVVSAPPSSDLSARAGLYLESATGMPLRVGVNAGRLGIPGAGPLVPVAADRFRNPEPTLSFRSGDAFELRFTGPDSFEIVSMEGEVTRYHRAEPWSPTAAELTDLAGRYESVDLSAIFDVAPGDGVVEVRLNEGGQVVTLAPVARDLFQLSQMVFRFVRDDAGRVVGMDYTNPVLRNIPFTRTGGR